MNVQPLQSIDGTNNIWICKPASNARGVGIQLFNNLSLLLNYVNNSDFVVQKYVEQPYTILNKKYFTFFLFIFS